MQLDPIAAAAGVRLIAHDILGSTNAEALARSRRRASPARSGSWRRADTQAAAGAAATWVSAPGNLYASLLLTDPAPAEACAGTVLCRGAGVARRDRRLRRLQLAARLSLKWPNDLLIADNKFAGILIEGEAAGKRRGRIGIGVNCLHHPAADDRSGDRSCRCRRRISPQQVCSAPFAPR